MRLSPRLVLFAVLLVVHGVITALAMAEFGYVALFERALADWASRQVFSDLSVSLVLITVWMLKDGRERGINAWPYVVLTLPLGSFAPLFYLFHRELPAAATRGLARA
ncbi:MAG: DUF2834 domain-containing protein [Myxococcota bacterium]